MSDVTGTIGRLDGWPPYRGKNPALYPGTRTGAHTAGALGVSTGPANTGDNSVVNPTTGGVANQQTAAPTGALGGGGTSPQISTNQGAFTTAGTAGLGFQEVPGYNNPYSAVAQAPAAAAVPQVQAAPPTPAAAAAPTDFTDEDPYSAAPGATFTPNQAGLVTGGVGPAGSAGGYQFNPASRANAAQSLGYDYGTPNVAAGLGSVLGAAAGIPFLGSAAGALGNRLNPGDRPLAGSVGTIDRTTGGVYDESGYVYDPITGERIRGSFANQGAALGAFGFGNTQAPYATAAEAGLRSVKGDREIAELLGHDVPAGPVHVGATGTFDDYTGIRENAPGQGVTFASGNLQTDSTGQVVSADIPGHDDDDHYTPDPAQVQAEKNVGLDAFGGPGDDGGPDDNGGGK